MKLPEMIPVESSQIVAAGHDKENSALYIRFPKDVIWKYTPVTDIDYKLFREAKSKGSFFHQHIKTNKGITAQKVS